MRRQILRLTSVLCLVGVLSTSITLAPFTVDAQVRATYDLGAAGLGQLLRRLQTTASAMHTGAHPDDEDTALIARLARGEKARVAYLSLTRGEGGQNIIGQELFEPLGVIRTEELLQSRRLDGGEQLFTRSFEFGFTKTRAEAAQKWGERVVLGDMVRAIRIYRPFVIISRFSGTPADGHGQHQLAGYLTPQAFKAAGDPNQFPEQIAQGLQPWQARKLYVSEGFMASKDNVPSLRIDTGKYDPLIGRSYYEIAAEGRSQHKSQEMGSIELHGPQTSGVRLLDSMPKLSGDDKGIFDGIDTSIKGIAAAAGLPNDVISLQLSRMQDSAAEALVKFDSMKPEAIIPALAEGLKATREARARVATLDGQSPARFNADFLLAQKEREFSEALQRAAGVVFDPLSNQEIVAAGESINIAARAFLSNESLAKVEGIEIKAPAGWQVAPGKEPAPATGPFARFFRERPQTTEYFVVTAPEGAQPTQPYWLTRPRNGYLFQWSDDSNMSLPFEPPFLNAEAKVSIGGVTVTITKPIQYRYADDIRGEIRREINVVPALSLGFENELTIVPASSKPQKRRIAVRIENNAQSAMNGSVALGLPAGWTSEPASAPFSFARKGEKTAAVFTLTIPANTKPDGHRISVKATTGDKVFDTEMHVIAYPHIMTHRLYEPAVATIRVLDVKTADVKVGYIMGSGDRVPEAIKQLGLKVTLLDENDLSTGDLSQFDTIVVGIRASEVRPDYVSNNGRLLDFVKNGGTLIVQYQRPDYLSLGLNPYPAEMATRVTDENAQVTVLQPQHAAFNYPNKITSEDWSNWVQERSLYNFKTFDAKYTPLLEAHDPGEDPQKGGEVYAEIGKGKYVYTSYAWFRQLPAGVPGAYRLFANLISLSKAPSQGNRLASRK